MQISIRINLKIIEHSNPQRNSSEIIHQKKKKKKHTSELIQHNYTDKTMNNIFKQLHYLQLNRNKKTRIKTFTISTN